MILESDSVQAMMTALKESHPYALPVRRANPLKHKTAMEKITPGLFDVISTKQKKKDAENKKLTDKKKILAKLLRKQNNRILYSLDKMEEPKKQLQLDKEAEDQDDEEDD